MVKYLIWFSFFFSPLALYSQNNYRIKQTFSLGYLGEYFLHTGIQANYKYCYNLSKDNFKHNLEFGANLFLYSHPQNHVGLRLTPSLGYRYINSKGWNIGLTADYGIFHRFYSGKVYTVDEVGNVKSKFLAGQSSLSYGAFLSAGKNFYLDEKFKWGLFCDIGLFREIKAIAGKGITHPAFILGFKKNFTNEN